jgi:ribonuclease P protein component
VVRLPRDDVDRPAVAYAISRRVGGAVVRNRLRRQLRVLANAAATRGSLRTGSYLVIVAPEAAGCSSATLSGHFDAALARLTPRRTSED